MFHFYYAIVTKILDYFPQEKYESKKYEPKSPRTKQTAEGDLKTDLDTNNKEFAKVRHELDELKTLIVNLLEQHDSNGDA